MKLAIVIPTLGRSSALAPLVKQFEETTPSHRLLFVCERGDKDSLQATRCCEAQVLMVPNHHGYTRGINAGVAATEEPYVLLGADDIRPHEGWFEKALAYMTETVGFVSLNDLGHPDVMGGHVASLPLVARWYIKRHGPIYDEAYHHNGADFDASLRARERGAFAYAPDAVMEHMHPSWGKGEMDTTYSEGGFSERGRADERLLRERWSRTMTQMGI